MILPALQAHPYIFTAFAFVQGACIGSFLNVVAYRLPLMARGQLNTDGSKLTLSVPNSRCPDCLTPIRKRHNVPLVGWAVLGGKCAACEMPIPVRYPMAELVCGVATAAAALVLGPTKELIPTIVATWLALTILLAAIDDEETSTSLTMPWGVFSIGWYVSAAPSASSAAVAGATALAAFTAARVAGYFRYQQSTQHLDIDPWVAVAAAVVLPWSWTGAALVAAAPAVLVATRMVQPARITAMMALVAAAGAWMAALRGVGA